VYLINIVVKHINTNIKYLDNYLIPMGRIDAIVDDSVEKQFRIEVTKRMGGRKGDLTKAIEQAMQLWIIQEKARR
jgi:Holliday junction resolvase-like predicted endonuclease